MIQLVAILLLVAGAHLAAQDDLIAGWPTTEGQADAARYSPLADINRDNVASLVPVWTYRHGDFRAGSWPTRVNTGTAMESTPIVVDGRLIFTTPFNRVIALDPETGDELWVFDPQIDLDRRFANMIINRGVAYWRGAAGIACPRRVFLATLDARLIALDAATGQLCREFGAAGTVNLLEGLAPVADSWAYNVTSPPAVVGDVVIVGSSIADTVRRVSPPGDVRGYDARTGALVWTFHTIPREGERGSETWAHESGRQSGGANVWTSMAVDRERGLVFLPVSTATPDFYGGDRPGANLFSDSLVALDAATGRYVWHFQTVHHDLWDYDLAAPPNLVRIVRDGRTIDAIAQATKHGFVFVLDRETGEPIFPVEERAVPPSDVPGEQASRTQPFPSRPPPLMSQRLTKADLWDLNPAHLEACRQQLSTLRNDGLFTPPSTTGSILYPFTGGGANWSGAGYDPVSGWLFVPVGHLVHVITIRPLPDRNVETSASRPMRGGIRGALFAWRGRGTGLRYFLSQINGRRIFAEDDIPCNKPPWGTLVAVDLHAGEIRWTVPTGVSENGVQGLMSFGPPLVTAGGLVFHSGNRDLRLRAHDSRTGDVVASFDLPAGLHSGPITYGLRPDGKQYLVVAPGGHVGLGSKLGDYVIAYALP